MNKIVRIGEVSLSNFHTWELDLGINSGRTSTLFIGCWKFVEINQSEFWFVRGGAETEGIGEGEESWKWVDEKSFRENAVCWNLEF